MSSKLFAGGTGKEEDIKRQLDSTLPRDKIDGMKRLIASISKGRDVSEFFTDVVKNVISDSVDLKKLVYTYLLHYAESKPDEALLSINSFQKDLSNRNQYIRAMALRVMSSIRLPMIAQIITLAIKKCAGDVSPYVRKTAAMAIPKVFHLDAGEREVLTEVIENLLGDPSPVVLGSAMIAFQEVCPDNYKILHKHYRRLCRTLVDVDEWGQIVIINNLLRYGRTQFLSPFKGDKAFKNLQAAFYSDEDEDAFELDDEKHKSKLKDKADKTGVTDYDLDNDHRLLLRSAQPLLQSRNSAVVMAVSSLFYHLAPPLELSKVAKALVRLLRNHREIQYVVLQNIAAMASERPALFQPYMKEFFVGGTDLPSVALFKVAILTRLADNSNVMTILKEFQQYIKMVDEKQIFVRAVVQAIGKIAATIQDVCDTCLSGLVGLLHHKNELIASEAVVVIRFLLQTYPQEHKKVVVKLIKLLDTITDPAARASIVWAVGEYAVNIPHLAADVVRRLAVSFIKDPLIVKKQSVILASKLLVVSTTSSVIKEAKLKEKIREMFEYILQLAKYDESYEIRDRARVLRVLLLSSDSTTHLGKFRKSIFTESKPTPSLDISAASSIDPSRFAIGSLSMLVGHFCASYMRLSDFPEEMPDPSVRDVHEAVTALPEDIKKAAKKAAKKQKKITNLDEFYASSSEEESGSGDSDESDESVDIFYGDKKKKKGKGRRRDASDESDSDEDSDEATSTEEEESSEESASDEESESEETSSEEEEESEEESSSEAESSDSEDEKRRRKAVREAQEAKKKQPHHSQAQAAVNMDQLLGFGSPGTLEQSFGALSLQPETSSDAVVESFTVPVATSEKIQLLKASSGGGLSVSASFTRDMSTYGVEFNRIVLSLTNESNDALTGIHVGKMRLPQGATLHPFSEISTLSPGKSVEASLNIDFSNKTAPARFNIVTNKGDFQCSITASAGELIRPASLSNAQFLSEQSKLGGMNEKKWTVEWDEDESAVPKAVSKIVALGPVSKSSSDNDETTFRFAGKLMASPEVLVLLTIVIADDVAKITLNCEDGIIAEALVQDLKNGLSRSE
eukprot:ANDGO_07148.mRNA.1 AP-3 complex subunit beta